MARTGRPRSGPDLVVTEAQRRELVRGARAATSTQAYALRCRIVLACAEPGAFNTHVAAQVGVSAMTVRKWRGRFIEYGLAGLADEPRPGRPPSILLDQVQQVVELTLEQVPTDATHWSRSSMAERTGLSKSTVGRIWRRFELKPHRSDGFTISTDPLFVEKVVDVVGLHHNPPERAVVLCVDEKSQIQALDRSQPVLPMMPGMPERRTRDYARHGTARPACSPRFNIADGTVIGELHRRHRAPEFRKLLTSIDNAVPAELDVHVVCDNYATHKTPLVQRCLAAHPRFHGALHPDRIFVAQPGRTLVHPLHPATTTAQRPQKRCGPGGRRPQLGRPKNTSSIRHPGPPSTDVVQLGCGHDVRLE